MAALAPPAAGLQDTELISSSRFNNYLKVDRFQMYVIFVFVGGGSWLTFNELMLK